MARATTATQGKAKAKTPPAKKAAPKKAAPKKVAAVKAAPAKGKKAAVKVAAAKTKSPAKSKAPIKAKAPAKMAAAPKAAPAKAATRKAAVGKAPARTTPTAKTAASPKAAIARAPVKKAAPPRPVAARKAAAPAKAVAIKQAAPRRKQVKPAVPAPAARRGRPTAAAKRPATPVRAKAPQTFTVSHLHEADFKADGLRPYALYRDLGIAAATAGLCQAHVIRFIPPTTDEVRIRHTHTVDLQLVYVLQGWLKNEFEGAGEQMMSAGTCWLQPSGIKHTVLEYSADCEVLEVIVPADFKTDELT